MPAAPATTLLAALRLLTDPRRRRGIRHPFAAVLALTFLGLLCRQTDFATLARWAKAHWTALRPALGFTRRYAPHATTLTRVTARYSLAEFQGALRRWLAGLLAHEPELTAAVARGQAQGAATRDPPGRNPGVLQAPGGSAGVSASGPAPARSGRVIVGSSRKVQLQPNKVNIILETPEITPHLYALIEQSGLPLRAVETDFATDSSGFSVSKFVRWFDEKYGRERSGKDWVKVHLTVGVKTGVVTAAAIYGRDANDCPILPELVRATAKNFTVREMSADKGYLSAENVEAIAAAGGAAFIPPRSNTTGKAGGLFERMVHYYQFRREEFLAHYHKRSNAESAFSSIKRKFGDNVRSRSDVAKVNEALAKLVCNNLCAVILSQCELGIDPVFWEDAPTKKDRPDILPMVRPG